MSRSQSLPRLHAVLSSDWRRGQATALPAISQRISPEKSPSRDSSLTAELAPRNLAGEQLRGALQVLEIYRPRGGIVTFAATDIDDMRRMVAAALAQLEGDRFPVAGRRYVRSQHTGTAELTPLGARVLEGDDDDPPGADLDGGEDDGSRELVCVHCGCTDAAACQLELAQLSPEHRRAVDLYFRDAGEPTPDPVPCWWISENPPVCSNPHCAELHRSRGGVTS